MILFLYGVIVLNQESKFVLLIDLFINLLIYLMGEMTTDLVVLPKTGCSELRLGLVYGWLDSGYLNHLLLLSQLLWQGAESEVQCPGTCQSLVLLIQDAGITSDGSKCHNTVPEP